MISSIPLHGVVVGQHQPDDVFNPFLPADFQKKLQEVSPESVPLPLIAEHDSKFSVIDAVHLDKPAHPDDLVFFRFRLIPYSNDRELAVVIVKTHPYQPIMCNALF